jgi:hypothetical protein
MKRQVNNLLFLYGFILAFMVGRTNYVQVGVSLLADINSKLSKPHREGKIITEQTTIKALPKEIFVRMPQLYTGSNYLNKVYLAQRVGAPADYYQHRLKTPTTNYGRDGP